MHEVGNGILEQDMPGFVHSCTKIICLLDAIYGFVVAQKRMLMADLRGNVMRSAKYIDTHYMEKLSIVQLAQVAFLSKYHYLRAFKKYIGMTPYGYLCAVRISRAQNLLITTGLSVDDIGWQVGFSGSKNLIRQFKQSNGVTPGEYRKFPGG